MGHAFRCTRCNLFRIFFSNLPGISSLGNLKQKYVQQSLIMSVLHLCLKVWRHIRNPHIYLKHIPVKFHSDPIWNDRDLSYRLFVEGRPNKCKIVFLVQNCLCHLPSAHKASFCAAHMQQCQQRFYIGAGDAIEPPLLDLHPSFAWWNKNCHCE